MNKVPRFVQALSATAMLVAFSVRAEQPAPELDFGYFKNEVQPIFLVKRTGNVACATCHAGEASSAFRLQPLTRGALYWDEQQSQQNFAAVRAFVDPGLKIGTALQRIDTRYAADIETKFLGFSHKVLFESIDVGILPRRRQDSKKN